MCCCSMAPCARTSRLPRRYPDRVASAWAAELAEISDFIDTIAEAYETRVGERGVNLSAAKRNASPSPVRLIDDP